MIGSQGEAPKAACAIKGGVIVKLVGACRVARSWGDYHIGGAVLRQGADVHLVAGSPEIEHRGVGSRRGDCIGHTEGTSAADWSGRQGATCGDVESRIGQVTCAADDAAVEIECAAKGIRRVVEQQDASAFLAKDSSRIGSGHHAIDIHDPVADHIQAAVGTGGGDGAAVGGESVIHREHG